MTPLKAILIDDELSSLQNLQQKLSEFCPDIEIMGSALKPEDGISMINRQKPDVVFLDIEMPRMNGFRMLEEIGELDFDIIFTTAYNYYAIDAIRISAFDYLMKPVSIRDLQDTVARLVRRGQRQTRDRLDVLHRSLSADKSQDERIAIPANEGLDFIPIKNIVHIESSSNYSKLFLIDGKPLLVTKLLKEFEDMLTPYQFFRVHNSHLINLKYIKKYFRGEGGQVQMQNGDMIDVSRRKKDEFLRILS